MVAAEQIAGSGDVTWKEAAVAAAALEAERDEPDEVIDGVEMLSVKLTQVELCERAHRMVQHQLRAAELEAEFHQIRDKYKALVQCEKSASAELAKVVHHEAEDREVKVQERTYFRTNTVKTVRLDTNELVRERAVLPAERQPVLPHVNGSKQLDLADAADDDGLDDPDEIVDPDAILEAAQVESKPRVIRRRKAS